MKITQLKEMPKIVYKGANSMDSLAFKYYNPEEVILGKKLFCR